MAVTLKLNADSINRLDLAPVRAVVEPWLQTGAIASHEQEISFEIDFPREPNDPRELSEIPEIRLWYVRLNALYPWMPFLLNWEDGELARYAAMLVPHQFSPTEGVQFNPEALEIFVMEKVFVLVDWLQQQGTPGRTKIKFMTKMLGYELEDGLFDLLES